MWAMPKGKKKVAKSAAPRRNARKKTAKVSQKIRRHNFVAKNVEAHVPEGVEKMAASHSGHHFLYRVRTIVGWTAVVAFVFATLSLVASKGSLDEKSSPLAEKLSKVSILSADEDEISIFATGDVLLARTIEAKMRAKKDYTYPFHTVAEILKSADIAFANLETAMLPGKTTPNGSMVFRADEEAAQGLKFAGFDVMSVANNHTMNYKAGGLMRAIRALKKAGIAPVGGGENQDAAHTPAMLDVKGKRIAFYAYNDPNIPPGFHGEAKIDAAGIAKMDIETVKNDVRNARQNLGADIIVVSMHAGKEYKKEPTQFQKDFAHAAIDSGASLIIGHHPHVVQPPEFYGDGVILYSLGNFVFDQFFSQDVRSGAIAKIYLKDEEKPRVEFVPTYLDTVQPRILEGDEAEKALARMGLK